MEPSGYACFGDRDCNNVGRASCCRRDRKRRYRASPCAAAVALRLPRGARRICHRVDGGGCICRIARNRRRAEYFPSAPVWMGSPSSIAFQTVVAVGVVLFANAVIFIVRTRVRSCRDPQRACGNRLIAGQRGRHVVEQGGVHETVLPAHVLRAPCNSGRRQPCAVVHRGARHLYRGGYSGRIRPLSGPRCSVRWIYCPMLHDKMVLVTTCTEGVRKATAAE